MGSLSCSTSLVGHKDTVLAMDAVTWGRGGEGGSSSSSSSWQSGELKEDGVVVYVCVPVHVSVHVCACVYMHV